MSCRQNLLIVLRDHHYGLGLCEEIKPSHRASAGGLGVKVYPWVFWYGTSQIQCPYNWLSPRALPQGLCGKGIRSGLVQTFVVPPPELGFGILAFVTILAFISPTPTVLALGWKDLVGSDQMPQRAWSEPTKTAQKVLEYLLTKPLISQVIAETPWIFFCKFFKWQKLGIMIWFNFKFVLRWSYVMSCYYHIIYVNIPGLVIFFRSMSFHVQVLGFD